MLIWRHMQILVWILNSKGGGGEVTEREGYRASLSNIHYDESLQSVLQNSIVLELQYT